MEKDKCKCGKNFNENNSIGSEFGLCQDCWEAQCDKEWWEIMPSYLKL